MSFPGSIPSYTGFTSTHTLQQDSHAAQHNSEQADIAAVATKVGTGASTPSNNTVLRGNGAGTSGFDTVHAATDISGILGVGNGGTGVSTSTGTGAVVLGTAPSISNPTITGGGSWAGGPAIAGGGSWAGAPALSQPVISDFTNSNHSHKTTAQGGLLDLSAIDNTAWVSYTPTWSGVLDTSVLHGFYRQIGKTVCVRIDLTLAGTFTIGTAFALPLTAIAYPGDTTVGRARLSHTGVQGYYLATVSVGANTTQCTVYAEGAVGGFAVASNVSASSPVTWAATDFWYLQFVYQAA